MATAKLIVGYRTRPLEAATLEQLKPQFTASKALKAADKIAQGIADKEAQFIEEAANMPYTGTFDSVVLADPKNEKIQRWDYKGREPGSGKQPICLAVASWILKQYPDAFSWDTHEKKKPQVVFVGFNPRLFLKMLGTECSLPEHGKPLPPTMWYSNSDHRDIEEAVCPSDFKRLTLQTVLKRRRPAGGEAQQKWDEVMSGWEGPGVDPVKDVWLATELSAQLGFLKE